MKICIKCKLNLKRTVFFKAKANKDGLEGCCKKCKATYIKKHNQLPKVKKRILFLQGKYRRTDKYREKQKKYRQSSKGKAVFKKYALSDKRKVIYNRYRKNSIHYKQYRAVYQNKKYKKDVDFKLRTLIRQRMRSALKNKQKIGSAIVNLGCSIKELKKFLERQFKKGMTWDNHGKWHIDHIKPLSKFNLQNKNQFLEACHYSNLQPLWALDNILKSNK